MEGNSTWTEMVHGARSSQPSSTRPGPLGPRVLGSEYSGPGPLPHSGPQRVTFAPKVRFWAQQAYFRPKMVFGPKHAFWAQKMGLSLFAPLRGVENHWFYKGVGPASASLAPRRAKCAFLAFWGVWRPKAGFWAQKRIFGPRTQLPAPGSETHIFCMVSCSF